MATKKLANRKGPADSATKYPVGTLLEGLDGREWVITETATGVHRWRPATEKGGAARARASGSLGGAATPRASPKPRAARKGPSESAKDFTVGAKRLGNDGRRWVVAETATGVRRWRPVQSAPAAPKRPAPRKATPKAAASKRTTVGAGRKTVSPGKAVAAKRVAAKRTGRAAASDAEMKQGRASVHGGKKKQRPHD